MTVPPYVLAASTTGPAHARAGVTCQDAHGFRMLSDGTVATAVADGLGSAPWSDLGAAIAVGAAVESCAFERNPAAAVTAARVALESAATAAVAPLSHFACTLLVCLASADEVVTAHVGDGAAVIECRGRLSVLSPPDESEYVDEVRPLTAPDWSLSTRVARAHATTVALLTDGCQRAALSRRSQWAAHPGWWEPLFAYARQVENPAAGSEELARLLSGPRLSEHSGDDKTLLIAVLG